MQRMPEDPFYYREKSIGKNRKIRSLFGALAIGSINSVVVCHKRSMYVFSDNLDSIVQNSVPEAIDVKIRIR